MLIPILKLMRPKHWLKNFLIFISITFSGHLFDVNCLSKALGGFLAFSLLSSAVYVLNDIKDVAADRLHEIKRHRPIAAGTVSICAAYVLLVLLLGVSIRMNLLICGPNLRSFSLMSVYFLINVGYSFGMKNVPFLDIFLLVMGFLLRVFYGAEIIGEGVSHWVSLTIIALSFYLGLGKRRNELLKAHGEEKTRQVLRYYSFNFLDKFMYLCLTTAIVFYALWSADKVTISRNHTDKLIWTVPFVILLMMKYSANIETDSHGDPVDVIIHDKVLMLLSTIYALVILFLLYGPRLWEKI